MKPKKNFFTDFLIVGAGPVGCVLAERISNKLNLKCIVIDKRNHVAGNCYDLKSKKKILYHKYGPHYLRFKNLSTLKYLSKFTKWIKGDYKVKSFIDGKLYPFPINLTTLEMFFKRKFKNKKDAINFINKKKINIKNPKNAEEYIISKLGNEIYEKFYKNYTLKQWNRHPKNLSSEIVGRIPIRFNRNNDYVEQKLKFMPKKGYTEMFKNMLKNKNISVFLKSDFKKFKKKVKYKYLIYTGTPDSYFNYKYGRLEWRSLNFKFKNLKENLSQSCVQYNYPNNFLFTRKVEIKHVTKQKSKYTIISREYPTKKGDPYYPINDKKNMKIFNKYRKLILKEKKKNVFFEGRLASYKYLNTDEVIERALNLYHEIQKKILQN